MDGEFHEVFSSFHIPKAFANYELDEDAGGKGSLGIVMKFDCPNGTRSLAVKKYINPEENMDKMREIIREIELVKTTSNENLVKYVTSYTVPSTGLDDPESHYLITENGGELLCARIRDGHTLQYSMEDVKKWARGMLRGVQYLHSKGVTHTDLHPKNICISSDNEIVLLSLGKNCKRAVDRAVETRHYLPFEQLVDWIGDYDKKGDVWRIGVIVGELITGQPLFRGDTLRLQVQHCGVSEALLDKVRSRQNEIRDFARTHKDLMEHLQSSMIPERAISGIRDLSAVPGLADFLEKCLHLDPDLRLSTDAALNHEFLRCTPSWEVSRSANKAEAMAHLRNLIYDKAGPSSL